MGKGDYLDEVTRRGCKNVQLFGMQDTWLDE